MTFKIYILGGKKTIHMEVGDISIVLFSIINQSRNNKGWKKKRFSDVKCFV